jgi:hypothetical protein
MSVASGSLPPGLTFVQTGNLTAELHGTPTHVGLYTFTVEVRSVSAFTSKQFKISIKNCTIVPCNIPTVSLTDATVGAAYSEQIPNPIGTGPFTFDYDPDAIPSWIDDISSSGLVTSAAGPGAGDAGITFSFDVQINDFLGSTCVQSVSIKATCEFICDGPYVIPLSSDTTPYSYVASSTAFVPSTGLIYGGTTRYDALFNDTSALQGINPSTNTILGDTILSGHGIGGIVYHPSNGRLYCCVVSLSGSNWGVSVVDPSGPTELATVVVVRQALHLEVDAINNKVYIGAATISSSALLYSLDIATNGLSTIDSGSHTGCFPCYFSDANLLFANINPNELRFYSGSTLTFAGAIFSSTDFLHMAYCPDNQTLYATHSTGGGYEIKTYIIDSSPTTNSVDFIVPGSLGSTVTATVVDSSGWIVGSSVIDQFSDSWTLDSVISKTQITLKLVALGTKALGDTIPAGTILVCVTAISDNGAILPSATLRELYWCPIIKKIVALDRPGHNIYTIDPTTNSIDCTISAFLSFAYNISDASNCKVYVPYYNNVFPYTNNGYKVYG